VADVQVLPQGRAGLGPTMTRARVARRATARRTAAVRFRVDFGRDEAVGPGKIALLELIAQEGSLSQAARELHMSYRRA
jgi:molybdate transport system regulatory protein